MYETVKKYINVILIVVICVLCILASYQNSKIEYLQDRLQTQQVLSGGWEYVARQNQTTIDILKKRLEN